MLRIAVAGAAGRMGKTLIQAIELASNSCLGAAIVEPDSEAIGVDAGALAGLSDLDVKVVDNLDSVINDFDVLIDFTAPQATIAHLELCKEHDKKLIIGTTGFSEEDLASIDQASKELAICMASNFSTGVNLCFKLLRDAAEVLGDNYDVEIVEAHHRHKVDSPSGTALSMGQAVADGLGRELKEHAIYGREGQVGARPAKEIGFSTIRGGDVVGDHTVMFMAEGERIEITHKASSRMSFARGAVRAAEWINNKQPGFYTMQNVLGMDK